ncbi:transcriptional regulator [Opitutaceae bacterium TAV5]|nr:transcriptional regulator [Opitutaceae bacterium TAV5]
MIPVSHHSAELTAEEAGADDADAGKGAVLGVHEQEIVAIFVQLTQALGAPRSLGEIYGLLFASPVPLSAQDITGRLKISKGSVSQGLRFLRTWGAIKPVVIMGDRREFFEPVVELRQLVSGFIRERIQPELETWKARADALGNSDFAGMAPDEAQREIMENRVSKLQTWPKRAMTVLPIVARLLG